MNLFELVENGKLDKTHEVKKLLIPGQKSNIYTVYSIPLKYLYYNDHNGRINTAYKKHQAEFGELVPEPGDSEYNHVFEKFIFNSNKGAAKDTLESMRQKSQQEPAVVLTDGRVIDGNRRFTALRMLQKEENIEKTLNAVILPLDAKADEKKIKELELDLQLGREERVSYDPIDRIFDVYNTIIVEKIMTAHEYKKASGVKNTNGINRDIRLAELILKFINIISPSNDPQEKQIDKFYLARDLKLDGPIEEIQETINKLKSGNKEAATDATLVYLAALKAEEEKKAPTPLMRSLKNNILKDPERLVEYVHTVDSQVDDIIDAFEKYPVNSANDIKIVFSQNEGLKKSADILRRTTDRLVQRGKSEDLRVKSLDHLEDILETLYKIKPKDFDYLTESERSDAINIIYEIENVVHQLNKDLML